MWRLAKEYLTLEVVISLWELKLFIAIGWVIGVLSTVIYW